MLFERTIYPVGHGGFAVEQIKDDTGQICYTIVFDCGTKNVQQILTNHINNLKNSSTNTIDALVLSHFDKDHVNGINTLVSTFRVNTVYIPKIPEQYQFLYDAITSNAYKNIMDIFRNHNVAMVETNSGKDETFFQNIWKWKIKSMVTNEDWIKLQNEMERGGLDVNRLSEANYVSNNLRQIKQAYNKVFSYKRINWKGLLLLSYTEMSPKSCAVLYNNECVSNTETACLYTGDAKITARNEIKNIHNFVEGKKLLLMQIPHHGSKSNSDQKFVNVLSSHYFYCDKNQNRFSRNDLSQIKNISILFVGTQPNEIIINSITI